MKLYAWRPKGRGDLSFYVCAETEKAARGAVEAYIKKLSEGNNFDYSIEGWGTNDYTLTVVDPGVVIAHAND